jgi:tetratricopeptide (TPR) repeat protein
MKRYRSITAIFLLSVGLLVLVGMQFSLASQSSSNKPASVLLQEALYAEEIQGDIDGAIKIYEKIIKDKSAQRPHIAQAMYREGMCYLKLRKEQQAQEIFRTLVAQYGDQTDIISKVKPLLEDLGNADPATLMPPETLLYAEIGSPGRQVETILNMLKGTPLENPLAAIGPGGQTPQGFNSPAAMVSALLNPSMMAEFKKIRGMGIGIMGIPQENEPPALIVLFPGKSDALKGLLQMALGMAGKPMEAIEGMQTLSLPEGGCAVYDDTVVILATPKAYKSGQLAWSIKQYKGLTNEPTLASSNKSFIKITKKARQENLLTIWIDTDHVFTGLKKAFPEGQLPSQFLVADSMVNFSSIDDVISFISLQETGITTETNISFKDGTHSLAYDMIRTPNLNRSGFEAVPSRAIGLISFALGQAESAQAQAVGQKIQNMTGLDVGREIFANIEQVTLFIMPGNGSSIQTNMQMPPAATSFGLAITSHNPQQTRRVLTRILSDANLTKTEASEPIDGKYQVELVDGPKFFCYMDEDKKVNVVSLNPNVIEASISALKNHQSVLAAGPLQEQLSKMSPYTSKLILMNVGEAIRFAQSNMGPMLEENNMKEIITQLATSCDKTFYRLRTEEKTNNLNIRADISGIPPLNNLFVPIMQLVQIIESAQEQQRVEKQKTKTATVKKADRSPVIDGKEEQTWSSAPKYKLDNVIYSPISSKEDFSAYYKAMWDKDNLYILVDVTDENLTNDSSSDRWYEDDCIEVFIDADNSRSGNYDENDYQFHFDWDKNKPTMDEDEHGTTEGVEFAMVTTETGYRTEIKFPWTTLGTKPSPGVAIGLEVHVNDDDSGDRTKLAWSGTRDIAYADPRAFGRAELAGLIGWWKLDETQGDSVTDSSGNNINGTLAGDPKWQPSGGKIGGALEFDGDGDYVNLGKNSIFNITGQITVSAWIKVNAFNYDYTAIITKGDSAWRLQRDAATDHLEFACTGLDVPNMQWSNVLGTVNVNDNQWHHAVGVYDGEMLYLYVDGELDASSKATGTININDYPVYMCENAEQTDRFWNGLIDDVRVYNYALSIDDIKGFY